MKSFSTLLAILAVVLGLILLDASCYTVDVREQVIITQFQQVVGAPVTTPGLHFKMPFVQTVNTFSNQVLEWDGPATAMSTKDKVYIVVDAFGRWKIVDALLFMQKLGNVRTAQSRLDLLASEIRTTVARHNLIEVVRTTKGRKAAPDASIKSSDTDAEPLPSIEFGRTVLEKEILERAKPVVKNFGIELLDLRFKRINYNASVSRTIYSRMQAEREQIAERFRSEGAGEAAKILGNRDRDLNEIESAAYKKIQETEGEADARATEIYAKAYNQTPEAVALYEFTKSMDTLKKALTPDTTVIMTTDGDLLRYLKGADPRSTGAESGKGPELKLDMPKALQNLPSLLDMPAVK